jgi:hypothetical protein
VVTTAFDLVEGLKVYTPIDTVNRPMFGQAPYIINGILAYTSDSLGLTATLSYNVQGPRLVIAGIVKGFANVYEMPRNVLDFKVTKTLGKHFSMSVTLRDIFNAPVIRAYKLEDGGKLLDVPLGTTPVGTRYYDNFRYGTNYLLTLGYKF